MCWKRKPKPLVPSLQTDEKHRRFHSCIHQRLIKTRKDLVQGRVGRNIQAEGTTREACRGMPVGGMQRSWGGGHVSAMPWVLGQEVGMSSYQEWARPYFSKTVLAAVQRTDCRDGSGCYRNQVRQHGGLDQDPGSRQHNERMMGHVLESFVSTVRAVGRWNLRSERRIKGGAQFLTLPPG